MVRACRLHPRISHLTGQESSSKSKVGRLLVNGKSQNCVAVINSGLDIAKPKEGMGGAFNQQLVILSKLECSNELDF